MTAITLPLQGDPIPDSWPSVDKTLMVVVGATSGDITIDSQTTYELVTLPQYTIVKDIGYQIVTAFTASVTMTLGDTVDADGWAEAADLGCTTADTGIHWCSMLHLGTSDATSAMPFVVEGGYICDTGDRTLELVVGGANPAAGRLDLYVVYNMANFQRNFAT